MHDSTLRSALFLLMGSALLALAAACAPSNTPAEPVNPAAVFEDLETRLLTAGTVTMDYNVTSEGAFEADIEGRLEMTGAGVVRITGVGHFGNQPVALTLDADGSTMTFGNGEDISRMDVPVALNEAVTTGLMRMGILHNLARLTVTAPPDHGAGGAREWVVASGFSTDSTAITFDIFVEGQPSGSASLIVDTKGNPVIRRQLVVFPEGQMRVTERYSNVIIQP